MNFKTNSIFFPFALNFEIQLCSVIVNDFFFQNFSLVLFSQGYIYLIPYNLRFCLFSRLHLFNTIQSKVLSFLKVTFI